MAEQNTQQQFAVQKVYLKDTSLETPNAPEIFRSEWKPEANVELNTSNTELGSDTWEVVVAVTVTAKLEDKTAYLCEVHQAGIFTLQGFEQDTLEGLLGSYCPAILFPYAREAVSDLTGKAGFPPMVLAPVNFDAIYAQQRARQQSESQGQH
ncbi:MAG: protein-export chaperone SecB [Ectothiorhodospiraceae bacterium]|jgi:preprotein translocase subunit SecB